jgi:hypothetical protein
MLNLIQIVNQKQIQDKSAKIKRLEVLQLSEQEINNFLWALKEKLKSQNNIDWEKLKTNYLVFKSLANRFAGKYTLDLNNSHVKIKKMQYNNSKHDCQSDYQANIIFPGYHEIIFGSWKIGGVKVNNKIHTGIKIKYLDDDLEKQLKIYVDDNKTKFHLDTAPHSIISNDD